MINYNEKFLNDYCNWGDKKTFIFSIDVDFVPDFIISDTIELFEKNLMNATIFVTHQTNLIKKLYNSDFLEVGIHPNITVGTTQDGCNNEEIIKNLLKITDKPVSSKFHILGYSFRDLNLLGECGLKFDCSMLYYGTPYLLPTYHSDSDLVLAPYYWEDGHSHAMQKNIGFDMVGLSCPGIKIFNFHPIDLFFNTESHEHRNKIKNQNTYTSQLDESCLDFVNRERYGVRNYFEDLAKYIRSNKHGHIFCSELNSAARANLI